MAGSLNLVNRIGFGTWQIGGETQFGNRQTGWGKVDESEATKSILYAIDNGIEFFDTADAYGKGKSESILGEALKQRSHKEVKICTKVGSRWNADSSFYQDFSANWLQKAVMGCFSRLQVDHIDTLLLHSPPVDYDWANYDVSFLEQLIAKGLIARYGVSVKTAHAIPAIHAHKIGTVVESIFNILDRRLLATTLTFPDLDYISRVPLSSGFLTDKTFSESPVFGATDIRQYIPQADVAWMVNNVKKLDFLKDLPGGMQVSALRFCISFDPISATIPGMYKTKHVDSALMAHQLGPLPADVLRHIESLIATLPDSWK